MGSVLRLRARWLPMAALAGCLWSLLVIAQESKRLAIYAPQASATVVVTEVDGKDYVAITDVLQPLGSLSFHRAGTTLQLRFTGIGEALEAQFTDGKTTARVCGGSVELTSRFTLQGGRGLLPVRSLPAVLSRCFRMPVRLNERSRRMFLGAAGIRYSTELKDGPSRLVLSFSAPVNPTVTPETGRLRLVFNREPVVSGALPAQKFEGRSITGVSFEENNGRAELSIVGSTPLQATVSDAGKTITVTAALPASPPAMPAPSPMAAESTMPAPAPTVGTPAASAPPRPRLLVVIDPGHGGAETGAALGDIAEKDFNLVLARRLRAELEAHGLGATLLRDGDNTLAPDQRAVLANGVHGIAYIALHATAAGGGVRVYTADLTPAGKPRTFLPVATVQTAYVETSALLAGALVAELRHRDLLAVARTGPVRSLNRVAAPAVALEIGPAEAGAQAFSPEYQQSLCSAIAAALAATGARLEAAR